MTVVPLNPKQIAAAHSFASTIADVDMSAVDMNPDSKLRKLIFSCLLHENEDPRMVAIRLFGRDDPDFLNHSVPDWLSDERFWIAKAALKEHYHQKHGANFFQPSAEFVTHSLVAFVKRSGISTKDLLTAFKTLWTMITGKTI